MKWIIKTLLLLTLIVSSGSALINECKSDLYYANGVGMQLSEQDDLDGWKSEVNHFFPILKCKESLRSSIKTSFD